MQKIKRAVTDILLAGLILLCLFLVCRIWFGSYISPEKYDAAVDNVKSFISSPFSFFSKGKVNTFSYNMKVLLRPEKIVLNYAANRVELSASDAQFESVKGESYSFLSNMLTGEAKITEKTTVSIEEYFQALKGKSLFINYGNKLDPRLLSMSISGVSESEISGDASEIKDILIVFNDSVLNNVSVYIPDEKTDSVYKYSVEYNKAKLDKVVNDFFETRRGGSFSSYSFELNFHKTEDGGAAKVLFAPTILLEVTPKLTNTVAWRDINEFSDEHGLNAPLENGILREFKINPMTMRKFTDVSGSTIFVENFGTLAIDPKGTIEFKAHEGRKGISLFDENDTGVFDVFKTTALSVDFISNVCAVFPDDIMENLQLNSDLTQSHRGSGYYVINFDYFIDGAPVLIKSDGEYNHAITMEIENGNLLYFRQYLKKYYKSEETQSTMTSISAADKIVENTDEAELPVYINRMGTCFVDNGSRNLYRKWRFELDGKSEPFIVY